MSNASPLLSAAGEAPSLPSKAPGLYWLQEPRACATAADLDFDIRALHIGWFQSNAFPQHQQTPVKEAAPRVVFDISPIMAKLRSVLSEFKPDENLPDEPLQRMHHALLRHRRTQLSEPELQVVNSVNLKQLLEFWEKRLIAIGEWMMHCEEFVELPLDEKNTLLVPSSFLGRGVEEFLDDLATLLAISDEKAIIIDSVKFDFSSLTDHDPSYIRRSVSSKTLSIAEIYRERISDNLHDYYTVTMKTPNYAGRLIRIMSIVHCIENIHHERSKVMELARIFDIFKIEASEKGMFDC
uniref:NR LBD domain-containing protein n=1 Tax=Angiostrongylus cantonensis TaxID=6313 RepID=A0A0K0D0E9_ANGCA